MVYKAFVRPRLESGSLAWMGAAQTNLKRLDRLQEAAALIIGAEADTLDSLGHRRRVGALAYLYKLKSWDAPEKLRQMIPPKLERPQRGRTRASAREHDSWHENKFQPVPAGFGPDYIARGFPFCIIEGWNRLPTNFFTDGFDIAHLQSFKCEVSNYLRSKPTPLRGEAA